MAEQTVLVAIDIGTTKVCVLIGEMAARGGVAQQLLAADAPAEQRIQIMQRKANLGMNAVLSLSLALGRLVAARDGMELPEVLRGMEYTIDRDYLYGVKQAASAPVPNGVKV